MQSSSSLGAEGTKAGNQGKIQLVWDFFQESLQISTKKEGNDLAQSLWMRFSRGAVDAPSLEGFKGGEPGKLGKVG